MTMITYAPRLTRDPPTSRSLSTPGSRVAGATEGAPAVVKPIALDQGDSLSIRNGRGTRIRAASGVLWVTEENCLKDYVLVPGDSIALVQPGTAMVLAHRTSRIVIEVPAGVTPPRWVELAMRSGKSAVRIALAVPTTRSLSTTGEKIAGATKRIFAAIRAIVATLRPSRDVVRSSEGERAVTNKWMMRM
jgi:hypothetical protein